MAVVLIYAQIENLKFFFCNFLEVFFVRKDLVGDLFQKPFSAEKHFQPARYSLSRVFPSGHPANFGPYERR